ncbi:MAG: transposase [Puniceicoccales bacterium]|jgi:type I restriction enzyme R subunit/putative DNA methylase|nr:transposase [Puniceicoccales bacterium]
MEKTLSKYIHGYHHRDYLPHYKIQGGTYFVTFRLADSLPRVALEKINLELKSIEFPESISADEQDAVLKKKRHWEIEGFLDRGVGRCWLKHPQIAGLLVDTFRYFNLERYKLLAWVIMPNHVHVLVKTTRNFSVGTIVKTWKQYASTRAKKIPGISEIPAGKFWQTESFDHLTRTDDERDRIVNYIHQNPVKAKLCQRPEEWLWSSAYPVQTDLINPGRLEACATLNAI